MTVKSERKNRVGGRMKSRSSQIYRRNLFWADENHLTLPRNMNPGQNRDNLLLLAAFETGDAPLLMLTLSALWSHDTTVYSSTPTASAPQVSWTVVGGVTQRRAGEIAPLIWTAWVVQSRQVWVTQGSRVSVTGAASKGSPLTAGEHTRTHHPS